jgi:4-amino-4-deoxy-L-arabinose transferase-like glycosyltransferase
VSAPALPRAPGEPGRLAVLLLLALACAPFLVGLGEPPLWDANEPLYAEPPREALETGEWLAPPWNYKPWFVRPPLSSWLTMPAYAAFGATPFAARLPLALAAVATVLAVFALASAAGSRRTGVLAALVLAATPRYWLFARQLAGDVLMTACLVGAFALALPALLGREGARRRLLLAHLLVAVGVLAKGPVVVVLYAVPLVVAARLARPRTPLVALRPVAFGLLLALVAAPWFVHMTLRYGTTYLRDFFGHHHVRRALSDEVGGRPPWFLLQVIAGEGQPWVLLAPFAAARAWAARDRAPGTLLAWAGALFPLLFFSVPIGKRSVYLLPCYPMLAVAVAPFLLRAWDGLQPRVARGLAAVGAAGAVVGTVFLVFARRNAPPDLRDASLLYLVGLPVCGALLALAAWRRLHRLAVGVFVVAPIAATLAAAMLLPVLGRYMPVPRLARTVVEEARPGDRVVVYGISIHSLMFYARRPTEKAANPAQLLAAIPPGGRAFVLGQDDEIAHLVRALPLRFEERARAPYFKFQFSWNVLGSGRSTRDLVLVRADRPSESRDEGGGG